jgi:hypothetical protein
MSDYDDCNPTPHINIEKALHQVQKSLIANKSQFNSFGKYHYRSCEDILEALKKIIPEDSFVTMSDEIILVGDRYYIQATARFHLGGVYRECKALARESLEKKGMDSSQVTGSASSYARKYALNGLFCIDDSKDADTGEHEDDNSKNKYPPKNNKKQPSNKSTSDPEQIQNITMQLLELFQNHNVAEAAALASLLSPGDKKAICARLSPDVIEWLKSLTKNPIPKEGN